MFATGGVKSEKLKNTFGRNWNASGGQWWSMAGRIFYLESQRISLHRIWIHVCHDQNGGSLIFVQHLGNHSKSERKAWHCVCLKNLRGMRQSMSNAMLIIVRSLEFELQSEMRLIELASALELSEIRGFVIIVHQNLFCRRFRLLWCH